ncbi:xenotropic and polytropic retrovirus receptor 1a [Nematolebias whitei]|uniref:xenotropic and polytropic retrovirus receptor 1a n=1 Tax=Nematolebias whitei TaxID=451745 RepID=UPI00189BFE18|nr:xenotropic and polytropic retrovirus receptor 1a [Nematolebias whitei]
MKFAEHLASHITPEWRKQYLQYEAFKDMLYAAQDQAPSMEVTDEDTVKRYYAKFEERFFQTCEKELLKINTFYSEKLAEAQRRFATLQYELQSSLDAQRENVTPPGLRKRKTMFHLSQEERSQHHNIKDLKLAFSEFYLSLILLQNYQNLNFTGFRKILKKHDKILDTTRGADWRVSHVEVAPFYTCKKITQLITETETLVTTELEGGDRQKAMKRLRVPPLGAAQPALAWTTFRVGLYCGFFVILAIAFVLTGAVFIRFENVWPLVRIYRGGFLLIQFLFLLGINTYGWRQYGVNHVLIFEIDPRNNLSHQHLFEIAGFLGVLWCLSILSCLYSEYIYLSMQINPLVLYGFMVLFLINPFKTCYYKSRFWLLKLLFRVFTAPFHRVEFADFWLADQLNSLVFVLMDLEYLFCFYIFELQWSSRKGLLPKGSRGTVVERRSVWFGTLRVSSLLHADDVVLLASSGQGLQRAPGRFSAECEVAGMRVSSSKSEAMVLDWKCGGMLLQVWEETLPQVKELKYLSILFTKQSHLDADTFFYLLIVFSIISSLYTLIWDLRMDWGLFDRGAGENTFLREEIVYPHKAYYYCAIVEDVILRFAWTIQISLTTMTQGDSVGDIVATVLAPLEVFRRFVWNFFRLENEHLNNCGEFRAVRDISVAPLNADDQTLLEQMMDQEDGVRNRSGKKTWKGSHSLSLRRPLLSTSQSKKDTKVLIEDTDDEAFS